MATTTTMSQTTSFEILSSAQLSCKYYLNTDSDDDLCGNEEEEDNTLVQENTSSSFASGENLFLEKNTIDATSSTTLLKDNPHESFTYDSKIPQSMDDISKQLEWAIYKCTYGIISPEEFIGQILTKLEIEMQDLLDFSINSFLDSMVSSIKSVQHLETFFSEGHMKSIISILDPDICKISDNCNKLEQVDDFSDDLTMNFSDFIDTPTNKKNTNTITDNLNILEDLSSIEISVIKQWILCVKNNSLKIPNGILGYNDTNKKNDFSRHIKRLKITAAQLQTVIICECLRICKELKCTIPEISFDLLNNVQLDTPKSFETPIKETPQMKSSSKDKRSSRRKSRGQNFIDEMLSDHLAIESPLSKNTPSKRESIGSVSKHTPTNLMKDKRKSSVYVYMKLLDSWANKLCIWTAVTYPSSVYIFEFIDPILMKYYKIALPEITRQFKKRAGGEVTPRKRKSLAPSTRKRKYKDDEDVDDKLNLNSDSRSIKRPRQSDVSNQSNADNPFIVINEENTAASSTIKYEKTKDSELKEVLTSSLSDVRQYNSTKKQKSAVEASSFVSRLPRKSGLEVAPVSQTTSSSAGAKTPSSAGGKLASSSRTLPKALKQIAGRQITVSQSRTKIVRTKSTPLMERSKSFEYKETNVSDVSISSVKNETRIPLPISKSDILNESTAKTVKAYTNDVFNAFSRSMAKDMKKQTKAFSSEITKSEIRPEEFRNKEKSNSISKSNSSKVLSLNKSIKPRVIPKKISSPCKGNDKAPKATILFGGKDVSPLKMFNTGLSLLKPRKSISPMSQIMTRGIPTSPTNSIHKLHSVNDLNSFKRPPRTSNERPPLQSLDNVSFESSSNSKRFLDDKIMKYSPSIFEDENTDPKEFALFNPIQTPTTPTKKTGSTLLRISSTPSKSKDENSIPSFVFSKSPSLDSRCEEAYLTTPEKPKLDNLLRTPEKIHGFKAATPGSCQRLQKVLIGFEDVDWDDLA